MGEPPVQAMVLFAALLIASAFLCDRWGDRATSRGLTVMAAIAVLTTIVAMASFDIGGDPLRNCRESGGEHMTYADGEWGCAPVDEPVAPPPVQASDLLALCLASGGVRIEHLDGAWVCIPVEQAG